MNFAEIVGALKQGKCSSFSGISLPLAAYIVSQISSEFNTLLIIVPDEDAVSDMNDAISAFSDVNPEIFQSFDVIPYIGLDPDPDVVASRLSLLNKLLEGEIKILVASAKGLARKLPPPTFVRNYTISVKSGEHKDYGHFINKLLEMGYEQTPLVEDIGTFARRGGIVDVWSPGNTDPVRIEWDENKISSLRNFNPADQRMKKEINEVSLLPSQEFPWDEVSRSNARTKLQREAKEVSPLLRRRILSAFEEGIRLTGFSTFLPLFYDKLYSLDNYLPQDAAVIYFDPDLITEKWNNKLKDINEAFEVCPGFEKAVKPESLFAKESEFGEVDQSLKIYSLPNPNAKVIDIEPIPDFKSKPFDERWVSFVNFAKDMKQSGLSVSLCCHSEMQRDRLKDIISYNYKDEISVEYIIGSILSGFVWKDKGIVIVSDAELIDVAPVSRGIQNVPSEALSSLSELGEGDLVVHEKQGIGRFVGLVHLKAGDVFGDYLVIEYRGGDKLYVPVDKLTLVEKYISPKDSSPELDKLGGERWLKAKRRAKEAADEIAKDLVKLYASRSTAQGFSFPQNDQSYYDFCAAFPYNETEDQKTTIDVVMDDMGKPKPMDRLICGDVGFGKTEVALRAAFRAVMSGKQVAILVPTTVLALQHYYTFLKRFEPFPVKVEMLSRFKTKNEVKYVMKDLFDGYVDIVIGTHKLLQEDVVFKRLGLLVVDEEHRFGVKHKEIIKKMKTNVDTMTLTATPIPRTLYMSLIGIRDVSIIATPPSERQAISTYVANLDDQLVRRAVLSEVERGGQVFFVHNRVQTIHSMYEHLKNIMPEVSIVVGHGQMNERDLEKSMMQFLKGEAQVLLCTAIIESGLDIPNSNTIIINRADRFGLAQLYQLRGRVGRSSRHAYSYLLLPREGNVSKTARRRLSALVRYTALGSGFQIAMHDLELRGAGNVLGTAQSGHITSIGYEMYTKILSKAVRELKGEIVEEDIDTELRLGVDAFIPENYIKDSHNRMIMYRRLVSVSDEDRLAILKDEMRDRFGALPPEAENIVKVIAIKLIAMKIKAHSIAMDTKSLSISLENPSENYLAALASMVEKEPHHYSFTPKSFIIWDDYPVKERLGLAKNALRRVLECVSQKQD